MYVDLERTQPYDEHLMQQMREFRDARADALWVRQWLRRRFHVIVLLVSLALLLTACWSIAESTDHATVSIKGRVWHDLCSFDGEGGAPLNASPGCTQENEIRANGDMEEGEPGIAGLTVTIASGNCWQSNAIINRAITNEDGRFSFYGLAAGNYCVGVDVLADENLPILVPGRWTYPTEEGRVSVVLAAGDAAAVNFGWDYQFLPLPEGAKIIPDPLLVSEPFLRQLVAAMEAP